MDQNETSPSPRRINVRGVSGVGKSTFATELATRLGLPYVELDALHHGPDWSQPTAEEFRERVLEAIKAHPEGWVIDGNYDGKLGDTIVAPADTIVWLDLPFPVIYRRLWRRTLRRVIHKVELWNGNRETWRDQFMSRDSIFLWSIRSFRMHRRTWPQKFAGDPRLVRLRSDAAARRWLDAQSSMR